MKSIKAKVKSANGFISPPTTMDCKLYYENAFVISLRNDLLLVSSDCETTWIILDGGYSNCLGSKSK